MTIVFIVIVIVRTANFAIINSMKEFKDSYFCRLNLFMLIIKSNVLTISSKFAHLLELVPDV